mgnify:CR=1 FL=1
MADERRIILALDVSSRSRALTLAELLRDEIAFFKVGPQAFTACGPDLVRDLLRVGVGVFLDLKLHDIPNTAAHAAGEAVRLGCSMMTLHTLGGLRMLRAARERADEIAGELGQTPPKLLGVTILTSMDQDELARVGVSGAPDNSVVNLARLAVEAGLDGVVTSPHELGLLQQKPLNCLLRVTPGVRPSMASHDDQRRTMTPSAALRAGASYLVIGRPITAHADPLEAARTINQELGAC